MLVFALNSIEESKVLFKVEWFLLRVLSGRLLSYLKKKDKLAEMVTRCHSLSLVVPLVVIPCHSLSLFVIRCHSLSLVVTRCTIRWHSLSLVVPLVVIRCHSLYHSLSLVVTRCHSLSLDVPFVCLFINDWLFTYLRRLFSKQVFWLHNLINCVLCLFK